jgi:hypothetical protein
LRAEEYLRTASLFCRPNPFDLDHDLSCLFYLHLRLLGLSQIGQQRGLSLIKSVKKRIAADHQSCPSIVQSMQLDINSEPLNDGLTGFEEGSCIGKTDQPDQLLANGAKGTVAQPNAHVIDV